MSQVLGLLKAYWLWIVLAIAALLIVRHFFL